MHLWMPGRRACFKPCSMKQPSLQKLMGWALLCRAHLCASSPSPCDLRCRLEVLDGALALITAAVKPVLKRRRRGRRQERQKMSWRKSSGTCSNQRKLSGHSSLRWVMPPALPLPPGAGRAP